MAGVSDDFLRLGASSRMLGNNVLRNGATWCVRISGVSSIWVSLMIRNGNGCRNAHGWANSSLCALLGLWLIPSTQLETFNRFQSWQKEVGIAFVWNLRIGG